MDEFYKTRAGRQFIDSTMPRIAEELEQLNRNLETLATLLRLQVEKPDPPAPTGTGS